jgi:hypothetical protein
MLALQLCRLQMLQTRFFCHGASNLVLVGMAIRAVPQKGGLGPLRVPEVASTGLVVVLRNPLPTSSVLGG